MDQMQNVAPANRTETQEESALTQGLKSLVGGALHVATALIPAPDVSHALEGLTTSSRMSAIRKAAPAEELKSLQAAVDSHLETVVNVPEIPGSYTIRNFIEETRIREAQESLAA